MKSSPKQEIDELANCTCITSSRAHKGLLHRTHSTGWKKLYRYSKKVLYCTFIIFFFRFHWIEPFTPYSFFFKFRLGSYFSFSLSLKLEYLWENVYFSSYFIHHRFAWLYFIVYVLHTIYILYIQEMPAYPTINFIIFSY